VLNR
jgi:superfamily II DNA helicase RecQ